MTPPTTDTSREAVDKALGMCGLHGLHGTAQLLRALLAERDALRDQLAAARNETLEEAARVVDIEYEMHKDYRNASLLCNNDEDAQCRLISMTTCASISAAIDALKDTTPAPLFVSSRSIQMDAPCEDWQEHADKASAIIRGSAEREVTVQEAARVILATRWAGYGNSKAMQAMCNYVHADQGRMPFPASFYDGVMQAGLRAIAQEGQSDG